MVEWQARNIVPEEEVPFGYETSIRWPIDKYGIRRWTDMFSPRQLYGHCTSVEEFHELAEDVAGEIDRTALIYLAFAIDKVVSYNSVSSHWDAGSERIRGKFDRHDFS